MSITCAGFNRGIHNCKKHNNRILRSKTKQQIRFHEMSDSFDNMTLPEKLEEVMERWDYIDDGRSYIDNKIIRDFLEENCWRYFYK